MFMQKDMQEKLPNRVISFFLVLILGIYSVARAQAPDASFLAGCAGIRNGDLRGAVDNLNAAIARNNADERLFLYRGQALLGLRDYENAIRDFNESNEIVPGSADIWLARVNALSGDQDQALSFLAKHLGSAFRLPEDSIRKDPAFRDLQTDPGWFSLWEKSWYSEEEKTAAEVAYYLRKGRPVEAISLLDAEIGKSPSAAGWYTLRGEANYDQGNYAAAIADFTSALNLSKNIDTRKESAPYLQRGKAYLKAGRYKDAVSDLNRGLREDPVSFSSYLLRAEAYAGMKSYPDAIRDVQTYLKYFENDLQAVYQCGEYHYLAEDYINALKYFNRNMKEDPNSALNYKARGKTYLKSATYRYAVSDLSMSLDLNPDDSETWMYLGIAKIRSGDLENGCSDLQKSRQMGNTEVLKYIVDSCK